MRKRKRKREKAELVFSGRQREKQKIELIVHISVCADQAAIFTVLREVREYWRFESAVTDSSTRSKSFLHFVASKEIFCLRSR